MIMNSSIMFMFCMMMGVIMAISSNNWFSVWVGLEMSLMSFIPIMSNKNKLNSECCIKYFIVQSLSSSVMMMGVIMMSNEINYKSILMLAMMVKLGVPPFHTWMIAIIEGLDYNSVFIILTMMKLAPFQILMYMNSNYTMFIMTSLIVGSISGLNQNSIKKMISYSSIFNMAFIMSCISNLTIWMYFFWLYSMSLMMLTTMMKNMNTNFINQLMFNNYKSMTKMMMWLTLLTMGGFPPLLSFFGKLMAIKLMYKTSNLIIMSMMVILSLIVMFFYMRMIFISVMLSNFMPKWMNISKPKFNFYVLSSSIMVPFMMFNLKSL
uniref:NADH dehydrogenase subunit 2 n=1 Tax=Centrotypus laticornis TaxID=2980484 RepID=UPI0028FC91F0|nr:NADH dehydrogenase subunit 2 [Centrotypus laticornis]UXF57631.1 NADH dehydrogenase subunit 2 [Centrotypus laticornis]